MSDCEHWKWCETCSPPNAASMSETNEQIRMRASLKKVRDHLKASLYRDDPAPVQWAECHIALRMLEAILEGREP